LGDGARQAGACTGRFRSRILGEFLEAGCADKIDDDASLSAELLHCFGTCLLDRFVTLAGEIPNGMPDDLGEFVARG
jgi:hypothetical protein